MRKPKYDNEQNTKKAILESALRLFSRRGYERTSLSDIAKYAGVTRGAIYWHFDDKKELFVYLCNQIDKDLFKSNELDNIASPSERQPLDKLKEWMKENSSPEKVNFLRSSFFSMLNNIMKGYTDDKDLIERINKVYKKRRKVFSDILINCVNKGQLPKNLDIDASAIFILMFNSGYINLVDSAYADLFIKNHSTYVDAYIKSLPLITVENIHKNQI